MTNNDQFDNDGQADLLAAAVRLYEAEMYGLCLAILHVLMKCGNKEAFVLAGHCISGDNYLVDLKLANRYYEIACDLGSAVGCYNLFLNYSKDNNSTAEAYLSRAKKLGWEN